ncbi:hypothetical protein SAMN05428989_2482 [Pseudoxanthomonas sp. GM95]|uniref:hypothetical protein n=1 Tax=Pseudoxanthomonas sp. GM95 TaxID=1881043 RepID=UPI0008CC85E0|nr:hypothetical protein [Pseudoxanthomonas sp. GM95]SEL77410.1 hypothetical protein SAMN05428989_2482 [Pseudoxanthomonas sp. GM95]
MRVACLLLLSLLVGGCSCSRKPDPKTTIASTATLPPAPTPDPAEVAAAQRVEAMREEQRSNFHEAAGTLHRYLGALAAGDLSVADTLWVGGQPPPAPDDAALRALGRYSAHINTDTPKPLDPDEFPSRALEIPVRLRLSDAQGNVQRWDGWYRLRRKIGNDGWEISTASMRPQID